MGQPLFSPSSTFWRVNREIVSALAAPRAVLMQIAHPLVAAGVAEHSQFRKHRFARLYRTSMAAAAVTFGSREFAHRVVRSINQKHQLVHGILKTQSGVFPPGTPYDANDEELKLWVMSTVTDSALLVYDLFVGDLSDDERDAYYQDSLVVARMFGVPDSITPPTYAEMQVYMRQMIQSDVITVSETAREIARALFSRSIEGLLPERMRREFGFRWSDRRDRILNRTAAASRKLRGHLPSIFCASPIATLSHFRTLVTS